jgi:hypothetical protein
MGMARTEDDDLLVEFTVQLMEIDEDMPAERLVHEIKGAIKLMSPEGEEQPIGSLTAYLFNVAALVEEGIHLLALYDMREQHLADAVNRIFDFEEYEFTPAVLKKTGFPDSDFVQWHVHMFGLYLEPQHRGWRRGVRALRLLRWYTQRPGLLATARAFPESQVKMEAPQEQLWPPSVGTISVRRRWGSSSSGAWIKDGLLPIGQPERHLSTPLQLVSTHLRCL